jgi:hypothetical protein
MKETGGMHKVTCVQSPNVLDNDNRLNCLMDRTNVENRLPKANLASSAVCFCSSGWATL